MRALSCLICYELGSPSLKPGIFILAYVPLALVIGPRLLWNAPALPSCSQGNFEQKNKHNNKHHTR